MGLELLFGSFTVRHLQEFVEKYNVSGAAAITVESNPYVRFNKKELKELIETKDITFKFARTGSRVVDKAFREAEKTLILLKTALDSRQKDPKN